MNPEQFKVEDHVAVEALRGDVRKLGQCRGNPRARLLALDHLLQALGPESTWVGEAKRRLFGALKEVTVGLPTRESDFDAGVRQGLLCTRTDFERLRLAHREPQFFHECQSYPKLSSEFKVGWASAL